MHSSMVEARNLTRPDPLKDESKKDDYSKFSFSPFNLQLRSLGSSISLVVDLKQPKVNPRCNRTKGSCPLGNKPDVQNYIDFINSIQILAPVSIDSASKSAQPGLVFKSSKQRRKVQSMSDLSDLLIDFSPVIRPRNVIFSPTARWIFDSIEATMNRSVLMKSSLLFQPITLHDTMEHADSRPASANDKKTSKISPKKVRRLSELETVALTFGRQQAAAHISKASVLSCSSANSGSSYCSTSSARCFGTSAFIHCVWKDKVPYFLFSVDDDGDNIYVATPMKVKSSSNKGLDYIYLFHSWSGRGSKSKNHAVGKLNLSGRMTVTASVFVNSNGSKVMETEFVLFAPNEEHPLVTQKPLSSSNRVNGFSRKAADLFKSIHSYKHSDEPMLGESATSMEDMHHLFGRELGIFSAAQQVHYLAHDLSHNYELAAVVVKDYGYDNIKGSSFGGWGLKFLEKGQVKNADSCQYSTSSSIICKEDSKRNRRNSTRNVNVLIPSGFHGGPVARTGGPSCLTERWKANGKCDCGGWDMGCPLKVLKDDSDYSTVSPLMETEDECKSLELFVEGARQVEPTLVMLNLKEDLHVVYFQPTLSALQSFSIVVANIHSQMPHLYPDM